MLPVEPKHLDRVDRVTEYVRLRLLYEIGHNARINDLILNVLDGMRMLRNEIDRDVHATATAALAAPHLVDRPSGRAASAIFPGIGMAG